MKKYAALLTLLLMYNCNYAQFRRFSTTEKAAMVCSLFQPFYKGDAHRANDKETGELIFAFPQQRITDFSLNFQDSIFFSMIIYYAIADSPKMYSMINEIKYLHSDTTKYRSFIFKIAENAQQRNTADINIRFMTFMQFLPLKFYVEDKIGKNGYLRFTLCDTCGMKIDAMTFLGTYYFRKLFFESFVKILVDYVFNRQLTYPRIEFVFPSKFQGLKKMVYNLNSLEFQKLFNEKVFK